MSDRVDEPVPRVAPGTPQPGEADGLDWFDREFGASRPAGAEPDMRSRVIDPAPGDTTHDTTPDATHDATGDATGDAEPRPNLAVRAWHRIWRRPVEWATRPWPTERVVQYVVTSVSLVVTTVIMTNVVHLSLSAIEDLVFDVNTPTGGDFGAHVWGPAYLRDELLGSWRLNGWTMDWYAGMPAYRFYMVLPAIAITVLDVVLAYGVAMKVVAVLGLVTFPASCWAFGRLARFRYPMPELFAFAGLAFVLDESFSIYGGNLRSTMAGEFSFSIALSLGVLAIGLLAAGLRTGKYRVWASVMIAAACVSHGIVLIFVALAAVIFTLVWIDAKRLVYAASVGVTSLLLMAWWVAPFLSGHEFMTDMKYGARPEGVDDSFWDMFFPLTAPLDVLITTLAVIGFVACIVRRHLNGTALGILGLVLVAGVYVTRGSLPEIGLLWNPRLLPFVYLVRYLLMVVGAVEVLSIGANFVRGRRATLLPGLWASTGYAAATALGILVVLGFMFQELPGASYSDHNGKLVYAWGPFYATATNADAQGDGWSAYNFQGYEGRNEYYTEYYEIVQRMQSIGDDPAHGCGRAIWENNGANGNYGTTMALMLLPHWTDGCIGSMEGLFFEASGTTPYHFLTAAAISEQSSNPVRELQYENTPTAATSTPEVLEEHAELAARHMRDLGVRYLMVRTEVAKQQAELMESLGTVVQIEPTPPPWDVYEVVDADLVVPLEVEPVVVRERPGDQRERYLELGTSWFQHPERWGAMPAADGPEAWRRVSVRVDETLPGGLPDDGMVDVVVPVDPIVPVTVDSFEVLDYDVRQQSIEFNVDTVGRPVLVKVSYFPNWRAEGADGPYRIGPNMMVVIPTDEHVVLTYDRVAIDYLSIAMTLFGLALCVFWRIRGDVVYASEEPQWTQPWPVEAPPDDEPTRLAPATGGDVGGDATTEIDSWWLPPREPDAPRSADGQEGDAPDDR